jgi:ABC-type spermidine/putrescine transport system permease subunit II
VTGRAPDQTRLGGTILPVIVLVFLVAPMVIVGLASLDPGPFFNFPPHGISGRWFAELLNNGEWSSSLLLSLEIAVLAALISTVIGTAAGVAVARLPTRLRAFVLPFLLTPLIIPAIVVAIGYYRIVLDLRIVGNVFTFVGANVLLTAPLVAILVMGSAMRVDPKLEYASLACGASRRRTLIHVTLPLVGPTAIAAGAFAFIFAMGEVVVSLFLVSPGRTPLAVRMFLEAREGPAPLITAASTLLNLGSLLVLSIGALLVRRQPEGAVSLSVSGASAEPATTTA